MTVTPHVITNQAGGRLSFTVEVIRLLPPEGVATIKASVSHKCLVYGTERDGEPRPLRRSMCIVSNVSGAGNVPVLRAVEWRQEDTCMLLSWKCATGNRNVMHVS